MTVATYLPRLLPAWFLTTRPLPPALVRWLKYVPPAVMAAMLLPWVMVEEGELQLNVGNVFMWAALPTLALAVWTRNLFKTVLAGATLVAVGRYVASM